MLPTRNGSIHLFRFHGIDVYLHWSWFLVAVYMISYRVHQYSSFIWGIMEYVTLFCIVLMHEFGHSLACRSVGGRADQIVLWPLGGVAYVDPPQRAGATLWSIAAGPLVNVCLFPVLSMAALMARSGHFVGRHHRTSTGSLYRSGISNTRVCWHLISCQFIPWTVARFFVRYFGLRWGARKSLMIAAGIGLVAIVVFVAYSFTALRDEPVTDYLVCICLDSVLERPSAGAVLSKLEGPLRRIRVVACPNCRIAAAGGPLLGWWSMQDGLRYICDARGLSQVRHDLQRRPLSPVRAAQHDSSILSAVPDARTSPERDPQQRNGRSFPNHTSADASQNYSRWFSWRRELLWRS